MAWIESHQTLQRHPKVIGLAAKSQLSKATVIGHLHMLWWWAMDYAPTGDLSPFSSDMVAAAAEWEGTPEDWLTMLKEFRWVDPDGHLHDWDQYAGRLLEIRQKDRKRKAEERLERTQPNRNGRPADVRRTSVAIPTYPTQPNPTQPNPTQPTKEQASTPTAEDLQSPTNAAPKSQPKAAPTFDDLIPIELDTTKFRKAWLKWVADRRARRKPVSAAGAATQLDELRGWGEPKAIKAIHISIMNGWQGLFEPKGTTHRPEGGPAARERYDETPKPIPMLEI